MIQRGLCKYMKKILLETFKITCEVVHVENFFKGLTFSLVLLKDFATKALILAKIN